MSQASLLRPQTPPSQQRPSSTKSGKPTFGKALKHALSRRKRSGSLRNGNDDGDLDGMSQRSASIGPDSFISNEPSSIAPEQRFSEEVILESNEPRYVNKYLLLSCPVHASARALVLPR